MVFGVYLELLPDCEVFIVDEVTTPATENGLVKVISSATGRPH